MEPLPISEAMKKGTGTVRIRGWCYRERKSNKMCFIVMRDSSNIIQCVIDKESVDEKTWNDAIKVSIESSLALEGEIKEDKRAPTGFEIKVTKLDVVQFAEPFPITKDQSPEFLLDERHLWLRSRKLTSIMKIRSTVLGAIDEFYRARGFYEFTPPVFTPNACEGGSTLFEVKYFQDKVYLTQSWQLYAEAAIFSLEKIYCNSPCFRSEKSKTSRHLAEFYMHEMEIAWGSLQDAMKIAEEMVSFVVSKIIERNSEELKILEVDTTRLTRVVPPFNRITYSEALEILKKDGISIEWGKDLRTIEEDQLMTHYDKPCFVTNYPKEIMAFYKPKDPADPKTALCFDLLVPEGYGELIGGSQRDTDLEELKEGLRKEGEKIEKYEWYLDTRRYGSVPHAGFGMGVERLINWVCKLENIKDAIPFPRTMLRKSP